MTAPYLNVPVFSWPTAPGGLLYTYQPGSVSAKATYGEDGVTPNTNPVVLDVTGTATVRGDGLYHFLLKDSTGASTLWDADYYEVASLTAATVGAALYVQSDAEIDAGVTPTDYSFPPGDIRRYGATLDGTTDDTTAVQNWASVGGDLCYPLAGNALVTEEITLSSNTTITGCRGAKITQSVANLAIFRATAQSYIHISGLHFKQTAWGGSAYIAHVLLDSCLHCEVHDNEFEGVQWAGVYLRAAQYSTVRGNYFHDSVPQQSLAFTVAPVATATNAILTSAWTWPTGPYTVALVETSGGAVEGKQITFTNGSTTASWVGGLTNDCNAAFTVQCISDSGDIIIHSSPTASASYNIIDGNQCFSSTLELGIEIQDPYNGVLSSRNVICNNRITAHLGYGIIVYMPDTGDTYNQIIGNVIENISGNFAFNTSSGAGIYITGAGIGGTVVANNVVRNCCISTTTASLAPAAIGIAGNANTTGVPVTVTGNAISDMTQYQGILLTGVVNGGSVTGNVVRHPAANSTGHGIVVTNSVGVSVAGNSITNLTTTQNSRCILIQGLGGVNSSNVAVSGNTCRGGHHSQINTVGTSGGLVVGLSITGNTCDGGDASCIPLLLGSAQNVSVCGNYLNGTISINQSSATYVRYSNNQMTGTITIAGTCTGSFLDRSNGGVTAANIANSSTGCNVEFEKAGNSDPASGTFIVGDTCWRTDAVSGQRMAAVCTVAGTSGTWKVVNLS